jgi:integrase
MGKHLMRHPPKYVQRFIDRHGKARFYFRRIGFKSVPLPGLPWSPEFMATYEVALAGQLSDFGSERVKPGTLRALAVSYYNSAAFRGELKPITQSVYRNIIDRFCTEKDRDGQLYGEKRAATLQAQHIAKLMAARVDKPDSANGLRKVLRAMMKHAIEIGLRADDPTREIKAIKSKNKAGFHRWTDADIAQFEARHAIGSKPRLAMALGLYFGQARQDVVAMGPQHIRDGVLEWVRKKTESTTALELFIPVHPELRGILEATPSGHMTFLVTGFGRPFTAAGFGGWFRDQCNSAGLRHCTFHGLRKAAASRLADIGCTPHEIAAITGHASLKEIERYTRTADRKRLAAAAIAKQVKAGTSSVKPGDRFDKKGKKS